MAGAGNLAYLRKYGFKTFGDFWDEGYDPISNNRIILGSRVFNGKDFITVERDGSINVTEDKEYLTSDGILY